MSVYLIMMQGMHYVENIIQIKKHKIEYIWGR